jgi:hypothetical protein
MGLEIIVFPFALLVFALVTLAFFAVATVAASDAARLRAVWRSYAVARGIELDGGVLRDSATAVSARSTIASQWVRTIRVNGRVFTCAGAVLAVPPIGAVKCRTTGADGVLLGDAAFDDFFCTEALSLDLARRLLSPDLRHALSAFRLGCALQFYYERGRLSLVWAGGEQSYARLDEARAIIRMAIENLAPP